MPILAVRNLIAGYNGHDILRGVNFQAESGQRWAIIGGNGAGKSTLIKSIAGLLRPSAGKALIGDRPVFDYSARERARRIAYVPQKPEGAIPFTVRDFVMLGRYAKMGLFAEPGSADHEAVDSALALCDVDNLRDRIMTRLSGGELQRVFLAGALAQQAPLLLLDEPTTFLDPAHERLFFKALESAHTRAELTIVMVTHDINTALTSCTNLLALSQGRVQFAGAVETFRERCPEALSELYGIPFEQFIGSRDGRSVFGVWGRLV